MKNLSITIERYGLPTGIYRQADGYYSITQVIEICRGLLQDFALSSTAPNGTKEALYRSEAWTQATPAPRSLKSLTDCYNALKKFADTLPRIKGQELEVAVDDLPAGWSSNVWVNSVTFDKCPRSWSPTFTGGMHRLSTLKVIFEQSGVTKVTETVQGHAGLIDLAEWEGLPVSLMRTTTPVLTPVVGEIDAAELESVIHRLYLACMDCGCFAPKEAMPVPGGSVVIPPPHGQTPTLSTLGQFRLTIPKSANRWDYLLDNYVATTKTQKVTLDNGSQVQMMAALGLASNMFLINPGANDLIRGSDLVRDWQADLMAAITRALQDQNAQAPVTNWDLLLPTLEYTHALPVAVGGDGNLYEASRNFRAARGAINFLNSTFFASAGSMKLVLPYVYVQTKADLQALGALKLGTREGIKAALESGRATLVVAEYSFLMARRRAEATSTAPRVMAMAGLNWGLVPIQPVTVFEVTF